MSLYERGRAVADTLLNFVSGLGTNKDPRSHTQFVFSELNRQQLEQMYRSDWLARRIVDLPAEDATREWRQWTGDRAKLEKIDALEKKLDIQKKTRQALQRARLYGGSALVLGVDQGQPEEELELDDVGLNDLKFVVVVNRYELSAGPRIFNVDSAWYTRPEYYTVSTPMFGFFGEKGGAYPTSGNGTTSPFVTPSWQQGQAPSQLKPPTLPDQGRQVQPPNYGMIRMHPSRIIEFTGNELPDWRLAPLGGGWGDSVLQTVDDALRDFAMIVSGLASMINDMKMDVIKVPDLSRKLSTEDITRKTLERFGLANMAKSSINTLLLDKEEEWERIQTSFGSTPELIKVAMTLACAAGGVPETRIMGNAPNKGLASAGNSGGEVDIRNYYDDIGSKQKSQYKPMMMPLDRCLQQSAIGKYDPSIDYTWNPLYQPTAQEQAAMALAKAQTTQVYVTTGLINEDALREAVVSQLTEDHIYPGLEDAIDEFGSEPEEPPAALQPVPPNAPPGMMPKGQFEPNPFHMLRANQQAKQGQQIRVPPNRKPGPTQYEKVPPGAQSAQKPNGAKKPSFGRDAYEAVDENFEALRSEVEAAPSYAEDFNPYHDPETGRFISSEEGQSNVHKAGTRAVASALGGSRSAHSQRAMQQRQMTEPDDQGVHAMALKLAPVHQQVNAFLAAPAVKHGIAKVVADFLSHHGAGVTKEAAKHAVNVGVEGGLDYMIGYVAAHAAGIGVATGVVTVPHFAVAVAASYGVHILLRKAEQYGLNLENCRHLLGNTLHYLADHYHSLKHGVVGDADSDPVLAAIVALLPHFPRDDDGPLIDFDPNEPRDPAGKWTTGATGSVGEERDLLTPTRMEGAQRPHGGAASKYGLVPGDAEKYAALRDRWTQINNGILPYIDKPDAPEVQAGMAKIEEIVKQIHRLHADPGGWQGIGLPGGPRDVTIVGAGPAGMASAIFGGLEGLDTLLVEAEPVAGGQSRYSSRIENLSGYPIGVTGAKLSGDTLKQVNKSNAETKFGVKVTGIDYDAATGLKHLTLSNGETIDSRTVILAGGLKFRPPTIPGANGPNVMMGDGKTLTERAAGGNAVVIGGSNGAAQAALGAATKANHVYLVSRSPLAKLMSAYQISAVNNHPKITVLENEEVAKINRDQTGNMQSVETMKQKQILPAKALGVFMGSKPETTWLGDKVDIVREGKEQGKIVTDPISLETKMPGVFAAGDTRAGTIGRVGTSIGEGQMALRNAHVYLDSLKPVTATEDAMPLDDADDVEDLITRWFAYDRENPWIGQMAEDDA